MAPPFQTVRSAVSWMLLRKSKLMAELFCLPADWWCCSCLWGVGRSALEPLEGCLTRENRLYKAWGFAGQPASSAAIWTCWFVVRAAAEWYQVAEIDRRFCIVCVFKLCAAALNQSTERAHSRSRGPRNRETEQNAAHQQNQIWFITATFCYQKHVYHPHAVLNHEDKTHFCTFKRLKP